MIQRIQTLFLLACLVLSGLMLTGNLMVMDDSSGTLFSLSFEGLGKIGGGTLQKLWPLSALLVLVPLLSLLSIFLFRNRKLQMRVVMLVLLLSLGTLLLGAFYILMFDKKIDVTLIWKFRAVFPLITSVFAWLAYRSILKDDMLVKSYDRLR